MAEEKDAQSTGVGVDKTNADIFNVELKKLMRRYGASGKWEILLVPPHTIELHFSGPITVHNKYTGA